MRAGLWLTVVPLLVLSGLRMLTHAGPPPGRADGNDAWAARQFAREHPGERPLNWQIGAAAERFYRSRPMGTFVPVSRPPARRSDSLDFVACCIDAGLGAGARLERRSGDHAYLHQADLFDRTVWQTGVPPRPGDVVAVRAAPWMGHTAGPHSEVGVVGTDGMVYDFHPARGGGPACYGRQTFAQFRQGQRAPGLVIPMRLKPEYRYCIEPLPPVAS